MTISVDIHRDKREVIAAAYDRVSGLMDDLPATLAHFPSLETLAPLGDERYHWKLSPLGPITHRVRIDFATAFKVERHKGHLSFEPVKGVGSAAIGGRILLQPLDGERTQLQMTIKGTVHVPLSFLLKPLAAPIVAREFNGLVDGFVANLQRAHL
ncbi:hypothetical protein [Zavarzinia compransoris]|uniref:SRPBCC family protein n=1 Tax=Zavarzinia compransoris TaxID=1264899 RepID=A0A317DZ29_9PROT|nr:hypothetical protein [Zavarzinia compransoris]PWR19661.1 hypothetical protein DKG75_14415 [Zavarzinia compransoris]TDP43397.1 hypothetical protein DES42_11298 [Zavarzinia compransoris]